jgi:citrate lyase subunit beta / citryl-CoA lyase
MENSSAVSGNSGPKVRSDCELTLELRDGGGIVFDLKSKVKVLYGESIQKLCLEILNYFGISHAFLRIDDSGALPFVIAARLESVIRKITGKELEYLPELLEENKYSTTSDRFRFSRLYLPGNTPSMMINAGLHSADGIILDLEDSVSPEKKDEARILVRNALRQINFNGAERMVRINQGERGMKDLEFIVPHNVNLILIPKCEDAATVRNIENRISEIKAKEKLTNPVYLMPIIETSLGVEMAFEIARSASSVVAVAVGLEDLTADLGVARTKEGKETLYARTRIVNAAKASAIQPIDSVFSDVDDMDALRQTVMSAKALGFEGMGCIHPRQIPVIRQGFAPGPEEIEKSKKIVLAFENAISKGLGVVAVGSKMIDPPVVARAQKIIDLAVRLGLLTGDWINEIPAKLK